MIDEPQAIPETHGYATSGWNAAPTAAKIIARIAPMLGLEPRLDLPPADQISAGEYCASDGWRVHADHIRPNQAPGAIS